MKTQQVTKQFPELNSDKLEKVNGGGNWLTDIIDKVIFVPGGNYKN